MTKLNTNTLLLIISIAIFSTQSELLPTFTLYIPIIPLIASIYFNKNDRSLSISLLIISLFLAVDYSNSHKTPDILRYLIVFYAFLFMITNKYLSLRWLSYYILAITPVIIVTAYNYDLVESGSLKRDILVLIVCFSVFVLRAKNISMNLISLEALFLFFLTYVLFDIANHGIIWLNGGPLYFTRLTSLKSFIVFPTVFLLANDLKKKSLLYITLLIIGTTYLIIAYSTRMILLSYGFVLILLLFRMFMMTKKSIFVYIPIIIVLVYSSIYVIDSYDVNYNSNRVTSLVNIDYSGTILEKIQFVDPVRFAEGELMFSRNVIEIMIGSGLGTGMADKEGALSFLPYDGAAFSNDELRNNTYFNLHEAWIDYGYRFGMLFVIVLYTYLVKVMLGNDNYKSIIAAMMITLFTCASFSLIGVTVIFILSVGIQHTYAD